MTEIYAFNKTYTVPDKNWKWLTIDEDGTITIFVETDDEYQGEPFVTNSLMCAGYWCNPNGPAAGWIELGQTAKPKDYTEELYILELDDGT